MTKSKFKIAVINKGTPQAVEVEGSLIEIENENFILHHPFDSDIHTQGAFVLSHYETGGLCVSSDIKADAVERLTQLVNNRDKYNKGVERMKRTLQEQGIGYPVNGDFKLENWGTPKE